MRPNGLDPCRVACLPYTRTERSSRARAAQGSWVYDNQKIFRRYARSWMLVDLITAFPIDLVTMSAPQDEAPPEALQLVRMIRLVKLGRVIRASRIFKRWESYLGWSFSMIALAQFFLLVSFLAHWFSCLWILVGRNSIGMLADGVNGADWTSDHAAFGRSWLARANLEDATPGQLYGVALYVALACIFSGSGGSIVPASPLEYYVQAFMMMLGSAVWAYVVANGVSILSTLNPHKVHYRNQMDQLNFFADDKKLPKEMLVRLRDFFGQTQHVHRQSRYDELLDSMSARLKADAALCWAKNTLMRVP